MRIFSTTEHKVILYSSDTKGSVFSFYVCGVCVVNMNTLKKQTPPSDRQLNITFFRLCENTTCFLGNLVTVMYSKVFFFFF